jgi:uncharacterized protein Yka (UPF0111/DUF47 family)
MSRWFLPDMPDVLATLSRQAQATVDVAEAFRQWASGADEAVGTLTLAQTRSVEIRRELGAQLRSAFSTPLDQEDLYTLAERLEAVSTGIKNLVREADVLRLAPTTDVFQIAEAEADAIGQLCTAVRLLASDPDGATAAAEAARACEHDVDRVYRSAMAAVLASPDARWALAQAEIYRQCVEVCDRIGRVADRIWYTVVKEE